MCVRLCHNTEFLIFISKVTGVETEFHVSLWWDGIHQNSSTSFSHHDGPVWPMCQQLSVKHERKSCHSWSAQHRSNASEILLSIYGKSGLLLLNICVFLLERLTQRHEEKDNLTDSKWNHGGQSWKSLASFSHRLPADTSQSSSSVLRGGSSCCVWETSFVWSLLEMNVLSKGILIVFDRLL